MAEMKGNKEWSTDLRSPASVAKVAWSVSLLSSSHSLSRDEKRIPNEVLRESRERNSNVRSIISQ